MNNRDLVAVARLAAEKAYGITIPNSVTEIENDAFGKCSKLTIMGYEGSYAEAYAAQRKIPFEAMEPECTRFAITNLCQYA